MAGWPRPISERGDCPCPHNSWTPSCRWPRRTRHQHRPAPRNCAPGLTPATPRCPQPPGCRQRPCRSATARAAPWRQSCWARRRPTRASSSSTTTRAASCLARWPRTGRCAPTSRNSAGPGCSTWTTGWPRSTRRPPRTTMPWRPTSGRWPTATPRRPLRWRATPQAATWPCPPRCTPATRVCPCRRPSWRCHRPLIRHPRASRTARWMTRSSPASSWVSSTPCMCPVAMCAHPPSRRSTAPNCRACRPCNCRWAAGSGCATTR